MGVGSGLGVFGGTATWVSVGFRFKVLPDGLKVKIFSKTKTAIGCPNTFT